MSALELWVGPEPTVNRIGDRYLDQLEASGFAHRLDDIDRLASLGVRRVRFPLLWERTAPGEDLQADWSWSDARLERLRQWGVHPIIGLLHHGSGPAHTHLLDPEFPQKLAAYAARVAERYPWVLSWTPVNEPLTTARFSGLYGVWFPHEASDRGCVRALLNQVKGIALSMQAIRAVQPRAMLVQTDDLGHISATPPLQYQADFENDRRWLGYDLLMGRVDEQHEMWKHLLANGAAADELAALRAQPCPPDILGINTYATSERFLDHRLHLYPERLHGGNGRQRYVDVEAVRVLGGGVGGFEARLREAAARYPGTTLAITEAHIGCTREEQMRWLHEAWRAAKSLREDGVDVRAVTAWSAFGAHDWDSLLTQARGHYEPGLWDVRAPKPRATALVAMCRELSAGREPSHPVVAAPGWWRRKLRLLHTPHGEVVAAPEQGRPLLITGATGTLGRAFARLCAQRGLPYRLLRRGDMDICDRRAVEAMLEDIQPWAVINTAGYVRVDEAERDEQQWHENAAGPIVLAQSCRAVGAQLLTFSSDLVFNGQVRRPYVESDTPAPLNAYGRAKLDAERQVLHHLPRALVVRTSAFFGPWDAHNFITMGLRELAHGRPWVAVHDQVVSPTYVPDLVHACLDLLIDGEQGVWHLANQGAVSWAEFARLAAAAAGSDPSHIQPVPSASLGLLAVRPAWSVLGSERTHAMPVLANALARFTQAINTPAADEVVMQFGCLDHGAVSDAAIHAGALAAAPAQRAAGTHA